MIHVLFKLTHKRYSKLLDLQGRKSKAPSDGTLLRRTSEEVFVASSFPFQFIFDFHFVFISLLIFILLLFHFWSSFYCHLSMLLIHIFFSTSPLTLPWTIARFTPILYFHSSQPIGERFATLSFLTIPRSSYRERYGFEWAFFTHRGFLPYTSSPTFFTQPTFIKASWEPVDLSWRFQGLPLRFETYTQPICLFESHSVQQKVLVSRFYLRVTAGS